MTTNPIIRHLSGFLLLASAAIVGMSGAQAQTNAAAGYPDKPIHLIVGFPAGGGADILGRLIGAALADGLKGTVLVENKPGAASNIGAEYVAKSKPDGYTLFMGTNSVAVNPTVYKTIGYSTLRDFVPVSMVGSYPLYLIVGPNSPANSVQDMMTWLKANPDKANAGGSSTALQLATQLFKMKSAVKVEYVGYRGSNESLAAVATGELPMAFVDAPAATQGIKDGRVKALAVTSAKRSTILPNIPTMQESGIAGYEVTFWTGIFAPADTPPAIVARLQAEIAKFVHLPDFKQKLATMSVETAGSGSEEFRKLIAAEMENWAAAARAGNIRVE
jgi:tripartite-type tricarboxylate transporter receptor subunit TctC